MVAETLCASRICFWSYLKTRKKLWIEDFVSKYWITYQTNEDSAENGELVQRTAVQEQVVIRYINSDVQPEKGINNMIQTCLNS